jgi:hypothetical protein
MMTSSMKLEAWAALVLIKHIPCGWKVLPTRYYTNVMDATQLVYYI